MFRTSLRRGWRELAAVGAIGALVIGSLSAPDVATAATTLVGDPASYVNTLAGTGNGGGTVGSINNFPGPSTPFGMVQFSPDNLGTGQGYAYSNSTLRGFGLNHASQGCGAFGDIPILPTTADVTAAAAPWNTTNSYTHTGEVGEPGYYALTSKDTNNVSISSQLTATTRTGLATFGFPAATASPKVFVRSGVNNTGNTVGSITVDPTTGIVTGSSSSGHFCGKNNSYTVYFALKFEQDFSAYGTWNEGASTVSAGDGTHASTVSSARAGAYLTFPAGTTTIRAAVSLSYVSAANAAANMTAEVPTVDADAFSSVRQQTYDEWDDYLSKVEVSSAPSDDLTTFYDSLYRSLLHPNTFNDVNGQYPGFESNPVTHTVGETTGAHPHASQEVQYANFSDWDTYRSLAPLLAMLYPKDASDQAQSLVNDAVQSGSYPRWAFANASTNQMTGDNAVAYISQVYAFGAHDFDAATALDYMVTGASASENTGGTNSSAIERPGADLYNDLHYAPQTKQFQADHDVAGASITQEWSIDDFGIGRLADSLGESDIASRFQQRSNYWQNLFNPTTGFISPRDITGAFPTGDGLDIPTDFGYRGNVDGFGQVGYDEGNAEQYLWLVPQNVSGLVSALGGAEKVATRLDAFMTHGLNVGPGADQPYMWAGNEPDFQVPWLYNYVGQPWRTQEVVDEIRTTLFGPAADNSEPGNDDLGAQSSWYVWAALGLYPATPGTDVLTVNTPAFDESVIHLGNGKTLTVHADGAQTGQRYIAGLSYAEPGQPASALDKTYVPDALLAQGGTLTYTTAQNPSATWGTATDAAPPSFSQGSAGIVANVDPATVSVAPGASDTVDLDVQRIASTARSYSVSASSEQSGIAVAAASGSGRFDTDGAATSALTVTVNPSVPAGYYSVDVAVTAGSETVHAATTVRVSKPGSVSAAATVVGTSPEASPSGDFDGAGNSYSRDQLALLGLAPGAVKKLSNGTSIVWSSAPVGRPDTVVSAGQTITLDRSATKISFTGAGTNGGGTNTALVTYADGTTGNADYSFGDWVLPSNNGSKQDGTLAPVYGNTTVGWTPVRNASSSDPGAYIFATTPFTAPAGKRIVSVTLPTTNKARIFAIAQNAPTLAAASGSTHAGESTTVTGDGFGANEKVTFTIGTDVVGSTTADASGAVSATVSIPASTPAGEYDVVATGAASPLTAAASIGVSARVFTPALVASSTATASTPIAFSGTGFAQGEQVAVTLGTSAVTVTADASGAIGGSITAPDVAGEYDLIATGATSKVPASVHVSVVAVPVVAGPTTTSLSASAKTVVHGKADKLTATVTQGATGTVEFWDGARAVGAAAIVSGHATFTVRTQLAAGRHHLTAVYRGDATHSGSTSASVAITVSKAAASKISITGKSFAKNSRPVVVVRVAKLSDGSVATGKVTVYVGSKAVVTKKLSAGDKGALSVRLPKRYGTSIHVKVKYAPADAKNVSGGVSRSATVSVRR